MYRKILLPTDNTEASLQAVAQGLQLAKFHGAEVLILKVLAPLPAIDPVSFVPASVFSEVLHAAEQELQKMKTEAMRLGVVTRTILRDGDAVSEILKVATEEHVDLILMAAHPHGRIASLLLGSVSQEVLRQAPCPVQVIGEEVLAHLPVEAQLATYATQGGHRDAPAGC